MGLFCTFSRILGSIPWEKFPGLLCSVTPSSALEQALFFSSITVTEVSCEGHRFHSLLV